MTTKSDWLIERGATAEEANASTFCPLCDLRRPNWSQLQIGETNRFVCTSCIAGALTPMRAEAELAARALEIDWTGVKSEREKRLSMIQRWILPGHALTQESHEEFVAYRSLLNDLTVDYPSPADVDWDNDPRLQPPQPIFKERPVFQ